MVFIDLAAVDPKLHMPIRELHCGSIDTMLLAMPVPSPVPFRVDECRPVETMKLPVQEIPGRAVHPPADLVVPAVLVRVVKAHDLRPTKPRIVRHTHHCYLCPPKTCKWGP